MKQVMARLPGNENLVQLFLVCVFPIHVWAIVIFFYDVPSYLMHIPLPEIFGILAYVLSFSLLESLLVFLFLLGLAVALPKKWFLQHFTSQGVIFLFVLAIWFGVSNFLLWDKLLDASSGIRGRDSEILSLAVLGVMWLITCLTAIIGLSIALRLSSRFEKSLLDIAKRISTLSAIFLFIDVISISFLGMRFAFRF